MGKYLLRNIAKTSLWNSPLCTSGLNVRFGLNLRQKGTLAMSLKVNPLPWGIILGIAAFRDYHFYRRASE